MPVKKNTRYLFLVLVLFTSFVYSQNQAKIWYFGNQAGLDFATSPPTVLFNSVMNTAEGCATICDATGSLLFYTDGITIWNRMHVAMPNGTGLTGNSSTSQSAVVVKQPGSANLYIVFTLNQGGNANLDYSIVDMSLAGGFGAVTVKNTPVSTGNSEKLTSVMHCNGIDVWVVAHAGNSNAFRSYLVTSGGVNIAPVISNIGSIAPYYCMKISPNGKKLGSTLGNTNLGFELFDFDNSTGVVSRSSTSSAASPGDSV